jgi:hypothetical protein
VTSRPLTTLGGHEVDVSVRSVHLPEFRSCAQSTGGSMEADGRW